jgi:hypothetical protein
MSNKKCHFFMGNFRGGILHARKFPEFFEGRDSKDGI